MDHSPDMLSLFPRHPWDHQYRGVMGVIERFRYFQDPVCLTSPTGTGKSAMQIALAQWGVRQDWPVILFTNRRLLLEQTMSVLDDAKIRYGVRAASFPELYADHQMVQLSSIQTEIARVINSDRMQLFPAKLVLVDEAHLMKAAGAEDIIQRYIDSGAKVVGVTATPLNINHIYKHLVVACNTAEGRSCGALVKAIVYAPDEMDLSRIKPTKTGEYSVGDIRREVWTHAIIARVYDKWKEYNPDARPTFLYAPGVPESVGFAEHFTSKGVRAAHIDGEDVWLDGKLYKSQRAIRKAVFDEWKAGDIKVICNRFVCLDDQTEVLTDAGWVGMNDMTSDHRVANWDQGRVFFEQPRDIIRRRRQPGERMVVLETPRRSIRVTEDHELLYRTTIRGRFLKAAAKDIVDRAVALPVSGMADQCLVSIDQPDVLRQFARRKTANAYWLRQSCGYEHSASLAEAESRLLSRQDLRYKEPSELTVAECEFIGFFIGDGDPNQKSNGGIEYRLSMSLDHYPNICAWLDARIQEMGVDVRRHEPLKFGVRYIKWSMCRGTGFGPQQRRGLFQYEPYLNKDGSPLLWGLSSQQFEALLRGLWIANGTDHKDHTVLPDGFSICSTNPRVFDCLQAIAVCRGWRASIREYVPTNPDNKLLYHLSLTKTDEHRTSKYCLQFEDGWQDEEVWCVATSSGNIITRRKGSVTVMGNCREGLDFPTCYHLILATPIGGLCSYLQTVGRALRKSSETPDHVIITDHGGCLDSKTEVMTRLGWKGRKQISDDDEVAAYDRATGEISWQPILSRHDRPLEPGEKMYQAIGRCVDIRVTGNHRMVLKQRGWANGGVAWPSVYRFERADVACDYESRFKIPTSGWHAGPGVPLTDDELRFIGWFVTDGNLHRTSVSISQAAHQPWLNEIRSCLAGCGFDFTENTSIQDTTFGRCESIKFSIPKGTCKSKPRRGWGRLERYLKKDIADELMEMTPEQFRVFIHAVHLGDGAKTKGNGAYSISKGNKSFAERVQSIGIRCGWKCCVKTVKAGGMRKSDLYRINLVDTTETTIHGANSAGNQVRLKESPSRVGERVWCVANPLETLVVRRNGKAAIIGNSYHRHGSPNADRDWEAMFEIPEKDVISDRLEKMRDKSANDAEPISCPQCGLTRATGMTCPGCGFTIDLKKKSRLVWQKSGELKEVTGDIVPQRRVKLTTDTQEKWDKIFWPSRKSKSPRSMTFKQAEAAFFRENGYYPPRNLLNQPINHVDWSRKVNAVAYQDLRRPSNGPDTTSP